MTDTTMPGAAQRARKMILPLALAQFIASYAATNMNVAISAIAKDLDTTVAGVLIPRGPGGSPEEEAPGPARGNVTTAT